MPSLWTASSRLLTSSSTVPSAAPTWVWVKMKPPGDRRFWSMLPLTRVPFGVPIFDPQPHDRGEFPFSHPQVTRFPPWQSRRGPGPAEPGAAAGCRGHLWGRPRSSAAGSPSVFAPATFHQCGFKKHLLPFDVSFWILGECAGSCMFCGARRKMSNCGLTSIEPIVALGFLDTHSQKAGMNLHEIQRLPSGAGCIKYVFSTQPAMVSATSGMALQNCPVPLVKSFGDGQLLHEEHPLRRHLAQRLAQRALTIHPDGRMPGRARAWPWAPKTSQLPVDLVSSF